MGDQLATSAEALRLFFTDDVYLVSSDEQVLTAGTVVQPAEIPSVSAAAEPALKKAAMPEVQSGHTFKYLGKNLKNILILVNDSQNEVSTERGRELLRNIVKALQLTANDFALLNYAAYENVKFDQLQAHFSCKLVLSFGTHPLQLGLEDCEPHKISIKGPAQLVFSGNLDALAEDQQGKKSLWGSLKQIQL